MLKRTVAVVTIFMAVLCFAVNGSAAEFNYTAHDTNSVGNGNGHDSDFHEPVWNFEPPSTHTVKPPTHTVKPPTQTVKPPTQTVKPPTQTVKPPTQTIEPVTPVYTSDETYGPNDTWLIQWYLCGTDLETDGGAMSRDLKEMLNVQLPHNVKILIQTGGTAQWKNTAFDINSNATERFLYTSDGIQRVQTLPYANMGDPNTLADFLSYGAKNYPADHRVIVFSDHGVIGVGGICLDEKTGDALDLNDLNQAFVAVYSDSPKSKPFEVIAFDTCVTSTYEYANSIHKFGRYMVASEANVPNPGFYYTGWMDALAKNPGMNGRALGMEICKTFMEELERRDQVIFKHEAWNATMAVIDLAQIPTLGKTYEDFGNEALARAGQNPEYFYTIFGRAAMSRNTGKYNSYNPKEREVEVINQVDLLTFANEIKRQNVLTNTPDALIQAVENAVIYKTHGRYRQKHGGIAAYHQYSLGGGNFYDYEKQIPAPEPQKKFYKQLIRSHSNIAKNLEQEEEQNIVTDSSTGQRSDTTPAKTNTAGQKPGLFSQVAEKMTPAERERFKQELSRLVMSLIERGVWPKGKNFDDLTPQEQEKIWSQMTNAEKSKLLGIYMNAVQKAQSMFNVDVESDGTLTAQFTPEQLQYITNVRFMVAQAIEEGEPDIGIDGTGLALLGVGSEVQINWEENKFTGKFPTQWPTLNGVPIYVELTDENVEYDGNGNVIAGYNSYIVPIKLNGKDCSLEIVYDYTDEQYYILDVAEGIGDNGVLSRDSLEINKGDVITPIFPGIFLNLDYNLELTTVESNKSIKINDSLTIENTPLKDGQYAYLFQFTDWQGTNIGSRAFIIEFEDGKIESNVAKDINTMPEISVNPEGNLVVEVPEDVKKEFSE